MIAPLSWLREYVDIDCTPQELEEKLFSCGFEVENLEEVGARISRVVVGLATSCEPIEGTHLHLCEVDCGSEGKFQICCGADNVETGKKFPTALVGATVCETNKERTEIVGTATIQAGKLRGYDSFGMLCSGMELGLNEDLYPGAGYNGLLVLPDDAIPGADVKPIVGLDDWLFDIAITANRPDCQGIYGIAREVAAVLGKEMKPLPLSYREEKTEPHTLQVEVEAPQYCPRYEAHAVKDVKIAPSPAWLRRRLSLVGVSAISNMVDITNYVMLELGQPMHAFDRRDLAGDRIVVRTAKEGEKLVTLDEQELTLTESNLLICDGEKPVGLAGIMGGLNSEIKDTTTAVVFEAAKFARDNIRRSARALGKRTDASAHFEKGTDEYTVELAMKRALHLTEELGAGTVTDECAGKNTGNSIEKRPLTVSLARVNGVLGIEVPGEAVCRILANLDMEPELEGDALRLKIPAYREDMESYQDVAEEVIRFYGYEHIVPSFLKSAEVTSGGLNERQRRELKLKETLAGGGMYEAIH
ncbi:phenylalanine--tRNA ligase subunit beta [Stomatobaculum longum]